MDDNYKHLLTVSEAATRLGRSIEQVRRYLREGKLRGRRIGQQWFIEESEVKNWSGDDDTLRVAEPTATYTAEAPRVSREERSMSGDTRVIIEEIDSVREAIRDRIGGNVDVNVVALVRLDREEH